MPGSASRALLATGRSKQASHEHCIAARESSRSSSSFREPKGLVGKHVPSNVDSVQGDRALPWHKCVRRRTYCNRQRPARGLHAECV